MLHRGWLTQFPITHSALAVGVPCGPGPTGPEFPTLAVVDVSAYRDEGPVGASVDSHGDRTSLETYTTRAPRYQCQCEFE